MDKLLCNKYDLHDAGLVKGIIQAWDMLAGLRMEVVSWQPKDSDKVAT